MERPAVADHADRVLRVISGPDAARSALAASWRRSGRLHALDPASGAPSQRVPAAAIAEARERLGPILRVAKANLDRLFLAVGGEGCSVLLADRRPASARARRWWRSTATTSWSAPPAPRG
jgi:transcriptional regulator of acetoin/glycerol metabolism